MQSYVRKRMAAQGILGPPPASLLGGNAREIALAKQLQEAEHETNVRHDIVKRLSPFDHKCSQLYGKRFLVWFVGWEPSLRVSEPQLVQDVLSSRSFDKIGIQKKFMVPLFGRGIVMASGKDWWQQKQLLNPVFHAERVKGTIGVMKQCTKSMISALEHLLKRGGEAEVDAHQMLTLLTADIIAYTAFGSGYDGAKRYIQLEHELQEHVMRQSFYCLIPGYRLLPTKVNRDLQKINKEIEARIGKLIESRLEQSKGDRASLGTDILGLLLAGSDLRKENTAETRRLLVDECKTFFFAGHETTANVVAWAMLLLGLHPEWQHRARQEVRQVRGDNAELEPDMLPKLKIVSMILSETMRLYPPAITLQRGAVEDTRIGKGKDTIYVPKGVFVSVSVVGLHHDKNIWGEDADEFRPDRFLSEDFPSAAFIPFGFGSRTCIGRNFALTEAKLVLSILLDCFSWRVSPSYRHSPVAKVTLYPQHGMQLLISKA